MCNENLNLVKLLGNCPKGTKLYSPAAGELRLLDVLTPIECYSYHIRCLTSNDTLELFTLEGKMRNAPEAECMLFPSKDQRDWSKFRPYKEGDFLANSDGRAFIFKCLSTDGYPVAHGGIDCMDFFIEGEGELWSKDSYRKATENEIRFMMYKMKKEGYIWDAPNKKLYKDLPVGTPVLVSDAVVRGGSNHIDSFIVRRYAGNHRCYLANGEGITSWGIIIPLDKFKLSEDNFIQFNKEDNYGTSND